MIHEADTELKKRWEAIFRELPDDAQIALKSCLLALHKDALARADYNWKKHKAPMALYWKVVGVYAGHIARAILFKVRPLNPFHRASKTIIELENERMEWALQVFPDATAESSLIKLREEVGEIEADIKRGVIATEEYADALMCLFDSAGRYGVTPVMLFKAFEQKLKKNKAREWKRNSDNTYSHIKQ
jgi:hypothetical protein